MDKGLLTGEALLAYGGRELLAPTPPQKPHRALLRSVTCHTLLGVRTISA